MAGLVPAIHVARPGAPYADGGAIGTTWMPGTSPGMTVRAVKWRRSPRPLYFQNTSRRSARPTRPKKARLAAEAMKMADHTFTKSTCSTAW